MTTYAVTVSEVYKKTITVDADSETEAIQKASELWNNFSSDLDSPPLKEVRFKACSQSQYPSD